MAANVQVRTNRVKDFLTIDLLPYGLDQMNLRRLELFVAVAEELHFGRAAQRLHTAQPALSQQIRRLESEIGTTLFRRTSRRVELTAAGVALLPEAHRVIRSAAHAAESARRASAGQLGALRLGFVGSAAYDLLPRVVNTFRHRAPSAVVELHELTTMEQADALARGDIDVGIARDVLDHDSLAVRRLRRESLVAVLPERHPLAAKPAIGLAELADEALILFPRERIPRLYDLIVSACRAVDFTPNVVLEAVQFPTILGLVSASAGVALLPSAVTALRLSGVRYASVTAPGVASWVVLLTRPGETSPLVGAFMDVASSIVAPLPPAGHEATGPTR
jgi:DNA-binding transcriptional LysR family regulator